MLGIMKSLGVIVDVKIKGTQLHQRSYGLLIVKFLNILRIIVGDWFLNIRDDLYIANGTFLKECEKLKKDGKLQKVFTYNGFVKVVKKNGDWPLKLTHIDDVHDLFS